MINDTNILNKQICGTRELVSEKGSVHRTKANRVHNQDGRYIHHQIFVRDVVATLTTFSLSIVILSLTCLYTWAMLPSGPNKASSLRFRLALSAAEFSAEGSGSDWVPKNSASFMKLSSFSRLRNPV